jgi:DNA-directed RNA polymerase subunit M/transcription elongation factor TFIIS
MMNDFIIKKKHRNILSRIASKVRNLFFRAMPVANSQHFLIKKTVYRPPGTESTAAASDVSAFRIVSVSGNGNTTEGGMAQLPVYPPEWGERDEVPSVENISTFRIGSVNNVSNADTGEADRRKIVILLEEPVKKFKRSSPKRCPQCGSTESAYQRVVLRNDDGWECAICGFVW